MLVDMRSSEYGGDDTRETQGIQPPPHSPTATEQLRLMYGEESDPEEEG